MGEKKKCKYQSLSLKKSFINIIKKHIDDRPEFTSIPDFVRKAVAEKIDREERR